MPPKTASTATKTTTDRVPVDVVADMLGLSARRVQQLVAENVVPKPLKGLYNLRDAVKGYIRYLSERAIGGATGGIGGKHVAASIAESRARSEAAKAERAEIELAALKGELVPLEDVQDAWVVMATNMRARMLELPGKAGPEAMTARTPYEATEIVRSHVNTALEELANADVAANIVVGASVAEDSGDSGPEGDEATA